jgi:hypothetical protein
MAVKFMQNVGTDVELNRVQNNVAEALRQLENSITIQIEEAIAGIPAVTAANSYAFTWGMEKTENATRFMLLGGCGHAGTGATFYAPTADQYAPVPFAGTVVSLQLKLLVVCASNSGTITFTVRKNGVDTAMTIVLTCSAIFGTLAFASTTSGSFSVAVDDLLSIKVVDTGLGVAVTDISGALGISA